MKIGNSLLWDIIKHTPIRENIPMPNYHDIPNYRGFSVKISPISPLRKIFDWGYFTGNKVNFKIEFSFIGKDEEKFGLYNTWVYMAEPPIPGEEIKNAWKARDDEPVFIKDFQLNGIGELCIFLREKDKRSTKQYCLLTANVIHPDMVMRDVFMVIVGILGSLLVGILLFLLGFIEIVPHWEMIW